MCSLEPHTTGLGTYNKMRMLSMEKEREKPGQSFAGYYFLSAFAGIALIFLLFFAFNIVKNIVLLGIKYWYVALGIVILLLFMRKWFKRK